MNSLEEELDKEEEEELKEDLCEKMLDILERHNISYYPEDADLGIHTAILCWNSGLILQIRM